MKVSDADLAKIEKRRCGDYCTEVRDGSGGKYRERRRLSGLEIIIRSIRWS